MKKLLILSLITIHLFSYPVKEGYVVPNLRNELGECEQYFRLFAEAVVGYDGEPGKFATWKLLRKVESENPGAYGCRDRIMNFGSDQWDKAWIEKEQRPTFKEMASILLGGK